MTHQQKITQLKKVIASPHVSSVEVGFEHEADGIRWYSAVSRKNGEAHRYTVRFWEDSDGLRRGHCNCAGGAKDLTCRHLLKAAALDTEKFGQPLYEETVLNYRAHLAFEKKRQTDYGEHRDSLKTVFGGGSSEFPAFTGMSF